MVVLLADVTENGSEVLPTEAVLAFAVSFHTASLNASLTWSAAEELLLLTAWLFALLCQCYF